MTAQGPALGEFDHAGDDNVVPFHVDALDLRGRILQLGGALDTMLKRHGYPDAVCRLLGEAVVLAALLGSSLKFNGKFILQTQTDGPVEMLVADYAHGGAVRGYARFDAERLDAMEAADTGALLGKGTLALTIDQGANTQRYQGIVQLDGTPLEEAARLYFRQSEQIPTDIRLAVARQVVPGPDGPSESWRAGGIVAQFLPDDPGRLRQPDLHGGDGDPRAFAETVSGDEMWREAKLLLGTVEDAELIDPTVGPERLLYRLFHEHGVRVFEDVTVTDRCSCNRDKIRTILDGFSAEEIADSIEDGAIAVRCEFCSTEYTFDPAEFGEG